MWYVVDDQHLENDETTLQKHFKSCTAMRERWSDGRYTPCALLETKEDDLRGNDLQDEA